MGETTIKVLSQSVYEDFVVDIVDEINLTRIVDSRGDHVT